MVVSAQYLKVRLMRRRTREKDTTSTTTSGYFTSDPDCPGRISLSHLRTSSSSSSNYATTSRSYSGHTLRHTVYSTNVCPEPVDPHCAPTPATPPLVRPMRPQILVIASSSSSTQLSDTARCTPPPSPPTLPPTPAPPPTPAAPAAPAARDPTIQEKVRAAARLPLAVAFCFGCDLGAPPLNLCLARARFSCSTCTST